MGQIQSNSLLQTLTAVQIACRTAVAQEIIVDDITQVDQMVACTDALTCNIKCSSGACKGYDLHCADTPVCNIELTGAEDDDTANGMTIYGNRATTMTIILTGEHILVNGAVHCPSAGECFIKTHGFPAPGCNNSLTDTVIDSKDAAILDIRFSGNGAGPRQITCPTNAQCSITAVAEEHGTGFGAYGISTYDGKDASQLNIEVSGSSALYNSTIICPTNALCNVKVSGMGALFDGRITCPLNALCNVEAAGEYALHGSNIDAISSDALRVTLSAGPDQSGGLGPVGGTTIAQGVHIWCPDSGVCQIQSEEAAISSFEGATIEAERSDTLLVIVDGDKIFWGATIKCPPLGATSILSSKDRDNAPVIWSTALQNTLTLGDTCPDPTTKGAHTWSADMWNDMWDAYLFIKVSEQVQSVKDFAKSINTYITTTDVDNAVATRMGAILPRLTSKGMRTCHLQWMQS